MMQEPVHPVARLRDRPNRQNALHSDSDTQVLSNKKDTRTPPLFYKLAEMIGHGVKVM